MGRICRLVVLASVLAGATPGATARPAPAVAGFAGTVPAGTWEVSIHCAFHVDAAAGGAVAAITEWSQSGTQESSYLALVSWNHLALQPVVMVAGSGMEADPPSISVVHETITVDATLPVGGEFFTQPSPIAGGCGSSGASVGDGAVTVGGAPLPASGRVTYTALRASAFHGLAAGAGAGTTLIAGGAAELLGSRVIGSFEAPAGSLFALGPGGEAPVSSSTLGPAIAVAGAGPWTLGVDWATQPAGGLLYQGLTVA